MPSPAVHRTAAVLPVALATGALLLAALTGCVSNPPNAAAPNTPVPTATPDAGTGPTPAVEAPPAWAACVSAVERDHPDVDRQDVVPYEQGDVRDGDGGGAVVDLEVGATADGTPEQAFTCVVSGTPEAPVVDQVAPVAG